jgi:type II secretory pathway component PulK
MVSSTSEEGDETTTLQKGLVDMLSVYGTTSANVNTAPKEVLMSMGLTEVEADEIISAREEEPITDAKALVSQTGVPVNVGSKVAVGGTYSIIATGTVPDSEVRRRIKGVVRISAYSKEKFTILYWADNYPVAENLIAIGKNLWEQEEVGS